MSEVVQGTEREQVRDVFGSSKDDNAQSSQTINVTIMKGRIGDSLY